MTPAQIPQKAPSRLPSTPSAKVGPGSAPQAQPPLPARILRAVPAGQGALPAKSQQIPGRSGAREEKQPLMGGRWAAGGPRVGTAGAGLSSASPRDIPPAGPGRGSVLPKKQGLSLAPRPDPHPSWGVRAVLGSGSWL